MSNIKHNGSNVSLPSTCRTYQHQVAVSAENHSQDLVNDSDSECVALEKRPVLDLKGCVLSTEQVFHFLFACCRRILPKHLLGSRQNWRAFFRTLHQLISCPNEEIPLQAFQTNLKQSAIPWLTLHHKPTAWDNQHNTQLVEALVSFIVSQVLVRVGTT